MLKKGTKLQTAFDEYIIQDLIGQGGSAIVFKAINLSKNIVAIKVINRNTTTIDKLKRFKNEIYFCQNNTHPNIIKVFDYGTYHIDDINIIFYVMPFFKETLRAKMKKGIPKEDIFPIYLQMLEGIGYAHDKGIWHRDIKPENILVDEKNNVMISDFGIAHFTQEDILTSVETKAGDRLANYLYAAPEQRIKSGNVDGRCDIFALGLILNELFTGSVIAGTNFKTISSLDKKYGFIDSIVESMIMQSQGDRIYPAQNIIIRLKASIKDNQINTELEQLINTTLENDENFHYPCPKLIDADYKNSLLKLYLNTETPEAWNKILLEGNYSHSALIGYETYNFNYISENNKTVFYIRSERMNTIENLVLHFKEWIQSATSNYISYIKSARKEIRTRKEQEIQQQIKQKNAEREILNKLKNLI